MIHVLDHGHVACLDSFGEDLRVANYAYATFEKASDTLRPRDRRVIEFLANSSPQHTAPFYSCAMDFSVRAPLMVARQWWKHVVASRHVEDPFAAWNESSRRYMTEEPEFYSPGPESIAWRTAPEHKKQGSGGAATMEMSAEAGRILDSVHSSCRAAFEELTSLGICIEQARLALPAYGMYVSWRWTASLYAVAHFVALREEETAQGEIQHYARAVSLLAAQKFPNAWKALLGRRGET